METCTSGARRGEGFCAPFASTSISARFIIAAIFCSASPSIGGRSGSSNAMGTMRLFTSTDFILMSAAEPDVAEDLAEEEEEAAETVPLTDVVTEVLVVDVTVCTDDVFTVAEALDAAAAAAGAAEDLAADAAGAAAAAWAGAAAAGAGAD